jgi:hypothetical protein
VVSLVTKAVADDPHKMDLHKQVYSKYHKFISAVEEKMRDTLLSYHCYDHVIEIKEGE